MTRELGVSRGRLTRRHPSGDGRRERILAATLSAPDSDPAGRLELHLRAALAQLLPYCTPSGRRKLEARLDS